MAPAPYVPVSRRSRVVPEVPDDAEVFADVLSTGEDDEPTVGSQPMMLKKQGRQGTRTNSMLEDTTWWEVYGYMGLAMVLNIALGAGIVVWLFVNAVRVYDYSKNLDVEDEIVPTYEDGGYDYASPSGSSLRTDVVNGYDDGPMVGRLGLSAYDMYMSDNYKFQRRIDHYYHDTPEFLVGIVCAGALSAGYLWSLWDMTWNWKLFLQKSLDTASGVNQGSVLSMGASSKYLAAMGASSKVLPTATEEAKTPESARRELSDAEKARAGGLVRALGGGPAGRLKGKLQLAMEAARAEKEAERVPPPMLGQVQQGSTKHLLKSYATYNKQMIDKFVQTHAKIGAQDTSEVVVLLATIVFTFWGFYEDPVALGIGVCLMAVIYVAFVLTRDSGLGQVIMYETLEVATQIYQILVWGGLDVLVWMTTSEAEYQDEQAIFTAAGDGGAAVVVLAWLLAANLVYRGESRGESRAPEAARVRAPRVRLKKCKALIRGSAMAGLGRRAIRSAVDFGEYTMSERSRRSRAALSSGEEGRRGVDRDVGGGRHCRRGIATGRERRRERRGARKEEGARSGPEDGRIRSFCARGLDHRPVGERVLGLGADVDADAVARRVVGVVVVVVGGRDF